MLTDNSSAQTSPHLGPDGIDRRKQPRVDVLCGGAGELMLAELDGCTGGLIVDLSAGGMSVQGAGPVTPSSEFKVHFKLDQATSAIQAKARPAWHGGNGKLGICFVELADEAYHQLTQWLNSKSNVPQGETRIVCQQPAAEPVIAAAYDRLEENEDECLASKLARAYSALPPHQRTATRYVGSDVHTLNSVEGNSFENRLETHQETEPSKQYECFPRQEIEGQTRQEKALEKVCRDPAGESEAGNVTGNDRNRLGRHSCEVGSPQLEKSTAEYESLPKILDSCSGPSAMATREESTPHTLIPRVTSFSKSGSAREPSREVNTFAQIVAQARETTHADGAALALADPTGAVICKASLGKAPKPGKPVNCGTGLSGECIRTGRVIGCDDCSLDLRVPLAISRDLGLRSIVVVPIFANGKTVGILEVTSCAKAAFTFDHIAALQRLAKEASSISASSPPLPQSSTHQLGDLHDGPTPGFREGILARLAIPRPASTDVSITPLNGDQENAIACAPVADVASLAGFTSYGAPAADHCESTEDLISKVRAASSREVGQKRCERQPRSILRDTYAKAAATAGSIIANPADFSRKSLIRAGQVPWLCGLILIAGAILVGATAGWVLLIVETSDDFAVHFTPPPVPHGRVRPISQISKLKQSHSADAGKHRDNRVEMTEQVAAKQLLSSVDPEYPQEATLRQISGAVSLTLLIDRSGSVQAIEDVSGNRILAAAAEKAVRQWQFRRYLFRGQAVETLARVGFRFTLPDSHL